MKVSSIWFYFYRHETFGNLWSKSENCVCNYMESRVLLTSTIECWSILPMINTQSTSRSTLSQMVELKNKNQFLSYPFSWLFLFITQLHLEGINWLSDFLEILWTNPHNWIFILLLERSGRSQQLAFTSKVKQCPHFLPKSKVGYQSLNKISHKYDGMYCKFIHILANEEFLICLFISKLSNQLLSKRHISRIFYFIMGLSNFPFVTHYNK